MNPVRSWRYEYKMVIDNVTLDELKMMVLLHPKSFIERYPVRRVNNIYFDTNNLSNYNDALSGTNYRSKLRFRWYGEEISSIMGCMELKEKKGMLISKIIQNIDREFDLSVLSWKEIIDSIGSNLADLLKIEFQHACVPVIINSYYRYYYETLDGQCRITLDYNQKAYDQRIYSKPNLCFRNPDSEYIILEIKSDLDKDFSVNRITNYFPFRVYRNSKYTSGIYWI